MKFFLRLYEPPKKIARVLFAIFSTKSNLSVSKLGENCVPSPVGYLRDAVSCEYLHSADRLCQAGMCKMLDNSSIVEQDARIIAQSGHWGSSHPPLPVP